MNAIIIGTGSICGCHVHALRKRGVNIVAVCDIDGEKAKRFCQSQQLDCKIYTDWKQMLDEQDVDVVHICTPHYLHSDMAIYALNKNVNVFSEKPVCISAEQLNSLQKAVNDSSASYGVCFQNRFLPSNVEARRRISESEVYAACGSVLWNRDEKYYASGAWRGKWATEGGGALINQAIHTLDLMLTFTRPAERVTATMTNDHLKGVIEVEDKADLTIDCGAFTMNFYATTAANGSHPVTATFHTSNGVITILGDQLYVDGKAVDTGAKGEAIGKLDWGCGHDMAIASFYDCLESGAQFECTLESCMPVMKAVLGAYESAKTGKTVVIK